MAREIERLGPWFHGVELPGGLLTKTDGVHGEPADHPLGTWEIVRRALPASLARKTGPRRQM